MKRKRVLEDLLHIKKRQKNSLWNDLFGNVGEIWVSASAIKNYMLNDPLIDWLHLYWQKKTRNATPRYQQDSFIKHLCDMGIDFEAQVITVFYDKFGDNIKKVLADFNDLSLDKMQDTIDLMKKGIPIIEQAVLYNKTNKTFGVADLIIRSDWFNKIFNKNMLSESEETMPCKFSEKYHYRVIDIKLSSVRLCSNSCRIRNGSRMAAYKGQLTIYNAALGDIQGFIPNSAYILSKTYIRGKKQISWQDFDLLGEIDFVDFDRSYIDKTNKAISWIRNVKTNGMNWIVNPPSVPELYPNMSNRYDSPFRGIKQEIASEIKEITQIWMVGHKQRTIAHSVNVLTWDKCDSEILGMNNSSRANVVDQIIQQNISEELFMPKKIENNINNWQLESDDDFYIDFETINVDFINVEYPDKIMIFMIGIWYQDEYKSFIAYNVSMLDEYDIIDNCMKYLYSKSSRPRLFHWSHAEPSMFNKANIRHNDIWNKYIDNIEWIDMYKIFTQEPITIKNCFTYSLKDIAKNMFHHGMISTTWNNDISNGMNAMLQSIKYYKDKNNNTEIMINIEKYNKVDCKVLHEIMQYLRKKIDF